MSASSDPDRITGRKGVAIQQVHSMAFLLSPMRPSASCGLRLGLHTYDKGCTVSVDGGIASYQRRRCPWQGQRAGGGHKIPTVCGSEGAIRKRDQTSKRGSSSANGLSLAQDNNLQSGPAISAAEVSGLPLSHASQSPGRRKQYNYEYNKVGQELPELGQDLQVALLVMWTSLADELFSTSTDTPSTAGA
jgi:hypothetical protein